MKDIVDANSEASTESCIDVRINWCVKCLQGEILQDLARSQL